MSVLVYGVRQFIAEITAAFVGISEKLIPDAKPAVDCPAIFPFAPNAVIIGFIGSFLGGLVAMALMVAFHSETIMIPAAGICFFSGGHLRRLRLRLRWLAWRPAGLLPRRHRSLRWSAGPVPGLRQPGNRWRFLPERRLQHRRLHHLRHWQHLRLSLVSGMHYLLSSEV